MFEWADYLQVARNLAREGGDEAALRSAISRAYYAALGMAYGRLPRYGWQRSPGPIHHHVWRTYRRTENSDCRLIGELGFVLREQRVRADYQIPFPGNIAARAAAALTDADELLAGLAGLGPDDACF